MSRHQAVRRMIKKGQYDDEDEDDYEEEEEEVDPYDDSNFERRIDELITIRRLEDTFKGQFTRPQVIDALYDTGGDEDAAYDLLTDKFAKNLQNPQGPVKTDSKPKQAPKQQPPSQPPMSKQSSKNQPKHKHQAQPQTQTQTQDTLIELNQQVHEEQKAQNTSQIQRKNYQIVFDLEKFNAPYPDVSYPETDGEPRNYLNLVVVGHVDSGKSTLIGRLLHLLKVVDDRELGRAQPKRGPKEPIVFAFVTDEAQEEKDRLVTIDIGYKVLKLGDRFINLLDSPGHKDFGACQADYAILVIDSGVNSFESGFEKGGQTKEHAYLLRSLGVRKLIVGINKMDLSKWDQRRFNYIMEVVKDFLIKIGFREDALIFIPYSAAQGQNLNKLAEVPEAGWYQGPCLFQALNDFEIPVRADNKPARFTIQNCFNQHEGKIRGSCIFGKVESGMVQRGEKYVILPQGFVCQVKGNSMIHYKDLLEHDGKVKYAKTGAIVDLAVQMKQEVEFQDIRPGDVLCCMEYPIPVSNLFVAEIFTLELDCPIIKGQQALVHINGAKVPGIIKKLNRTLDRQGQTKKMHPRTIGSSEQAEVLIETQQLICMETFKNSNAYGKVILRFKMATLAVGKITEIKLYFEKLKQTQTDLIRKNSQTG